jgi:hypothetical protein
VLSLAAAWVLFPLVLVAVSAGLGLGLDRLAGRYLPGPLTLSLGAASAIAIARFVTGADATAELALPALLVGAVAGFVVGRERVGALWTERYALAAALAVFLVVGAPAYLTLEPTFEGYLELPDTSHQLAIASFMPENGPNFEKLPDSAYRQALDKYIGTEYPVAAQATLGVLAPLGVLEIAWLYHPFIAFLAAMGALSLFGIASAVRSLLLRAALAFAGAIPALVYAYALQGSIKEIAGLSMLLVAVAATADLVVAPRSARGLIAVLVPAVAMLGCIGPAAAAYLGPVLLVAVAVPAWRAFRQGDRRVLAAALVAAVAALALAAPVLSGVKRAYHINTAALVQTGSRADLGNLNAPLDADNASGIWLNGDYRWRPEDLADTAQPILIGFILLAALAGLVWAVRRRAWGPLLLGLALVPASLVLLERGTPYADGKVLMLLSPLALVFALLGAAWVAERRRLLGYAVAAVPLGALLVSQALAYHDSHPAPYERFEELLDLNDRLSDKGPMLVTEYDELNEYLLRDTTPYAQPEYPHSYRTDRFRDPSGLSDPDHRPSLKTPLDIDDLTSNYVQSVPTIVLRHSPVMSRPPANFERTYRGRYYDVWERDNGMQVQAHLPLGNNVLEPSAAPRCRDVKRLAAHAQPNAMLEAPARPRVTTFLPQGAVDRSVRWGAYPLYPGAVHLNDRGDATGEVAFPAGGRYRVWAEGSIGRRVKIFVDGKEAGSVQYELGNPGQYLHFGEISLERGKHSVVTEQIGGDLRPGNGGSLAGLRHLGPVVFSPPQNEEPRMLRVDPDKWRSLCGRQLDWVELTAPS